jgi:hypothetical protein
MKKDMNIDKEKKYLFIHIPKTAGESMYRLLKENGATGFLEKHSTALQARNALGVDCFKGYFCFSFVRNPWDQAVSFYEHLRKPLYIPRDVLRKQYPHLDGKYVGPVDACKLAMKTDFNEFVRRVYREEEIRHFYFYDQLFYLSDHDGELICNHVFKYEDLNNAVDVLKANLGLSGELNRTNKSERRPYREYYDEETVSIIEGRFRPTISGFGYKF